MKVLVGCERSGVVRDAFIKGGHDAVSLDLLPSETPGPHIIADHDLHILDIAEQGGWDLFIVHPDCTYLCSSGLHWNTRLVDGRKRWANQTDSGQNKLPPSADRWMLRARTYEGIADAMAQQWGNT